MIPNASNRKPVKLNQIIAWSLYTIHGIKVKLLEIPSLKGEISGIIVSATVNPFFFQSSALKIKFLQW